MSSDQSIETQFEKFNDSFELEQKVQTSLENITRNMEKIIRKMSTLVQSVHLNAKNPQEVTAKIRKMIPEFSQQMVDFQKVISPPYFYKLAYAWNPMLSNMVFICAFCHYLENFSLLSLKETEKVMGSILLNPLNKKDPTIEGNDQNPDGFFLDLEVFLFGLCSLPNELSRLSTNAVTAGNYSLVSKIHSFVSELYSGFRLLNLKNDKLRLKYDSIKYDLKKIEEIVYDLNVRKLL